MLHHTNVVDQVTDLLDALSRCREHCKVHPHNDWDAGVLAASLDGSTQTIFYTCQVCGRRKGVPA